MRTLGSRFHLHSGRAAFKPRVKRGSEVVVPAENVFNVPTGQSGEFMGWLQFGSKASRFMSFRFSSAEGLEDIYDLSSCWNIEVEAKPSFWNFLGPAEVRHHTSR
jgi:hypothetical protein